MKNKIIFGINSTLLATVLTSLFLPIDSTYIYGINLGLGILSFIFILATFFAKRERQFIVLSFFQLLLLLFWYVLIKCRYSPYRIGWKIYLYSLMTPISVSEFILANQMMDRRKFLLWCFAILQSCVFIKTLFFIHFYEFEGYREDNEDIRDYSNSKQYKVLNPHKLLNRNPEKLSEEDYKLICSLINDSDWIKDNFPEFDDIFFNEIDILNISNDIKYSFSVINLYGFKNADFYEISVPLKTQQTKITVYFPKGTFYLSKNDLEIYKKYYTVLPDEKDYCVYEGLGLPYNQSEYESYIDNYYNWSN